MRWVLPAAGAALLLIGYWLGYWLTDGSPEFSHYGRFIQLFAILMMLVGISRALIRRRNE